MLVTVREDKDTPYFLDIETVVSTSGKRSLEIYQHLALVCARVSYSDEEQLLTKNK